MQRLGYINIKGTSEVNSKKIILGSSLVAWWLEFQAFTVVMQVLPLVEGLRFSKMCGLAKKKKNYFRAHNQRERRRIRRECYVGIQDQRMSGH